MHSEIERQRHRIESEGQKDCALSVPGSHPPNRTTTTDPTPQTSSFISSVPLKCPHFNQQKTENWKKANCRTQNTQRSEKVPLHSVITYHLWTQSLILVWQKKNSGRNAIDTISCSSNSVIPCSCD